MSARKRKRLQVVLLQWEDAAGHEKWSEDEPMPQTLLADVAGLLLERKATHVTVGLERFKDGQWREVRVIPKSLIRRMEVLKTLEVDS